MSIAFVLGGAESVWDDLKAARKIAKPDLIICVNHVGILYPEAFDAWCSFHPRLLEGWRHEREVKHLPPAKEMWTTRQSDQYGKLKGYRVRACIGGSSGMLGTDIALDKGAEHVVLCGIPLSPIPHFHSLQGKKPWKEAEKHQAFWIKRSSELYDRGVRSMSGFTRELLGAP